MTAEFKLYLADEIEMQAFGETLARVCSDTLVIYLHGPLGAGKTTLVRGLLRGLGYTGSVKSPTYTLVETYDYASGAVFHFDFYRLSDPLELEYMGIQDYFKPHAICLIEWPDKGSGLLPAPDVDCYIDYQAEGRKLLLQARSRYGKQMLERLSNEK